jgi:hypothetical protein
MLTTVLLQPCFFMDTFSYIFIDLQANDNQPELIPLSNFNVSRWRSLEIKAHVVVVVVRMLMMFGSNLEIKAHVVVVMKVLMVFGSSLEIKAHVVVMMIVLMMFGSNLEIKAHVVVMVIVLMMFRSNQYQDVDAAAATATMAATVALAAATVAVLTVKIVSAAWVPNMMFVFSRRGDGMAGNLIFDTAAFSDQEHLHSALALFAKYPHLSKSNSGSDSPLSVVVSQDLVKSVATCASVASLEVDDTVARDFFDQYPFQPIAKEVAAANRFKQVVSPKKEKHVPAIKSFMKKLGGLPSCHNNRCRLFMSFMCLKALEDYDVATDELWILSSISKNEQKLLYKEWINARDHTSAGLPYGPCYS